MNLVFKVKVFGFIAALILGAVTHLIFGLFPGKKNKFDMPDYPEISAMDDRQNR